jgi:hypothetical protein
MESRSFPLCSNGCCMVCHAMYCSADGHKFDSERAEVDRARGIFASQNAADGPDKP